MMTKPARTAGVLLHPTSLPGPYGIGDLGPIAVIFHGFDVIQRGLSGVCQHAPVGGDQRESHAGLLPQAANLRLHFGVGLRWPRLGQERPRGARRSLKSIIEITRQQRSVAA